MQNDNLYDLILKCKKNDNLAFSTICKKFEPLLKKYSALLKYEDAYDDLLYCFIICLYKIPIDEIGFANNNAAILSYIKVTMKNQYIYLNQKYINMVRRSCSYESMVIEFPDYNCKKEIQDKLLLFVLRKYLSNNEIVLVYLKFFCCIQIRKLQLFTTFLGKPFIKNYIN